ncbi:hypothetical protein COLO4_28914 [Corchorus olitorius]|uniref:Uncharacterized protein n=1 Tax=Corchorus olitorius TaxID=93759 RepID=A0A1R3HHS4_9ROSI|nr:hypothetical protein COLO4_28914 [Corchorus olitorius]
MNNIEYYQRYSSKDALSSNARFDCQKMRMERGGVSWMLYCGGESSSLMTYFWLCLGWHHLPTWMPAGAMEPMKI